MNGTWQELHVDGKQTRAWGWDLSPDGTEPEQEVEKEAERNKWCVMGQLQYKAQ